MSDYKKRLNVVQMLHPSRPELLPSRPEFLPSRPELLPSRPELLPRLHLEPSLGVAQKEPYENHAEKQENQENQ
jgi:hypothetical protein